MYSFFASPVFPPDSSGSDHSERISLMSSHSLVNDIISDPNLQPSTSAFRYSLDSEQQISGLTLKTSDSHTALCKKVKISPLSNAEEMNPAVNGASYPMLHTSSFTFSPDIATPTQSMPSQESLHSQPFVFHTVNVHIIHPTVSNRSVHCEPAVGNSEATESNVAPNVINIPDNSLATNRTRKNPIRRRKTSKRQEIDGEAKQRIRGSPICAYCRQHCGRFDDLRKHLKTCHPARSTENFECDQFKFAYKCINENCKFRCYCSEMMQLHMQHHIEVEKFTPVGRQRSAREPAIKRLRFPLENYTCFLCPYSTLYSIPFACHMEKHLNNIEITEFFSCHVCGKDFATKEGADNCESGHKYEVKLPNGATEIHIHCPICIFTSAQTKKMLQHMRIHDGTFPHICPICSSSVHSTPTRFALNRRDNMRKHLKDVHGISLYFESFQPEAMLVYLKLFYEESKKRRIPYRYFDPNNGPRNGQQLQFVKEYLKPNYFLSKWKSNNSGQPDLDCQLSDDVLVGCFTRFVDANPPVHPIVHEGSLDRPDNSIIEIITRVNGSNCQSLSGYIQ